MVESDRSSGERVAVLVMFLTLALVLSVLVILIIGQVFVMKDLPHELRQTGSVDYQRERSTTRVYDADLYQPHVRDRRSELQNSVSSLSNDD